MATFNTLHIFGYGETQVIKQDSNKKVSTSSLTKTQAVIDNVYSKKPQDSDASADVHAVNIFSGMFADYQPKTGKSFRVKFEDLDAAAVDALVAEVDAQS